jgi:hypothetical protein
LVIDWCLEDNSGDWWVRLVIRKRADSPEFRGKISTY